MKIPILNDKKPDKRQDDYKYEPVGTDSDSAAQETPLSIPAQQTKSEVTLPKIPIHPSHSAVNQDVYTKMKLDPISEADDRAGNLFDYLNWRGDIPMSVDPFNEVDNLLLSALVYAPFDGLIPETGSITLEALNIAFWNKYTVADFLSVNPSLRHSPLLLKRISSAGRYKNIRACSFHSEVNGKDQCQFAAMTFLLDDGTCYAAFRGTDNSIIGWREDLNFSYMAMTRGQKVAVDYLNRVFGGTNLFIRVGGHSKGGNLAVYASMYCLPEVQERIRDVYSNDGPGFNRQITDSDNYKRILPKIIKFMPEDSIVGILLDSGAKATIVKSSRSGIYQHSPYTWMIRRNRIVRAKERSDISKFIDHTVDDWINMLDPDSKRTFIDVLFKAIESSGAKTISEFTDDPVRAYKAFYRTMKDIPSSQRMTMLLVLSKLAQSGSNQIVTGLRDYLSDLSHKS